MTDGASASLYGGPERRVAANTDAGLFFGLPIWARVVGLVGIPGTIALFTVWIGSQALPKMQTEIMLLRETIQAHSALLQQLIAKGDEHTRLLQKICSAQFKAEEEKQRCFDR